MLAYQFFIIYSALEAHFSVLEAHFGAMGPSYSGGDEVILELRRIYTIC
jgi:hypothetical protein